MTARRLDGTAVAQQIQAELHAELAALAARGVRPGLGALLVGDDPASAVYVRSKTRRCEELGLYHETRRLEASATTEEVLAAVLDLNRRPEIHGILVQLPLPAQVDAQRVLDAVRPDKDVDGFHPENVGRLLQKRARFVPCTPAGVMQLFARSGVQLAGCRAVVLGRSEIVGKPMALLLMHADATVTVCHSRTRDLAAVTREADVLVAAIGRPGMLRAEHVKPGAVVVDVGINRVSDPALARELLPADRFPEFEKRGYALVGACTSPQVAEVAGALTPVPGGVGPLTIAMLMANTVRAAAGSR
jgi:methylenetetrahydrofolate dehydrogenase (NADP+)/methenyltetrahydrofolate cyclohydrolase